MGLETLLLGAAASGGAAATGGLLGAGGAFSLGTTLSTVSAASSLLGGVSGLFAGGEQSENAKAQAQLAGEEQARTAAREAEYERRQIEDVTRRQKLAYLASGVSLQGSPLLVMQETRRRGSENIDEIIKSGASAKMARLQEGRMAAKQARSSGRRSFIDGIMGATSAFSRIGDSR